MKITMIESEILDAITAHVNSMMDLKEGTNIKIDLRATRGDAGYTAEIDITKPGAKKPNATPTPTPAPAKKKATPAPEKEAEKPTDKAPEAGNEPDTEGGDAAEGKADTKAEDAAAAEKPAEEATTDEAAKKGSGLFANLERPKNG